MSLQVSQPLSRGHAAVAEARRVIDALGDQIPGRDCDNLRLLVSELVTNAIRHGDGHGEPSLEVAIGGDRVRVAVQDAGPGFDPAPRPQASGDRGWGLLLVDVLAERWGVERGPSTRVWFDLRLSDGSA